MRKRNLAAIVAVVAVTAVPATASAKERYKIGFQKDCPELTCTGTLLDRSGTPIPGSSVWSTQAPLWTSADVVGYSAVETFEEGRSKFTMNLVGIADYSADPTVTLILGAVAGGSWHGRPLTGALVQGSAQRVGGTTFEGTLQITPRAAKRRR